MKITMQISIIFCVRNILLDAVSILIRKIQFEFPKFVKQPLVGCTAKHATILTAEQVAMIK